MLVEYVRRLLNTVKWTRRGGLPLHPTFCSFIRSIIVLIKMADELPKPKGIEGLMYFNISLVEVQDVGNM
jgi:hypothetical protein